MQVASAGTSTGAMLVMGQVLLPYGVKGWLRVRPHTATPEGLLQFRPWWLRSPAGGPWREVVVVAGRPHAEALVVQLEGIESREAALALRGFDVGVPRGALPDARAGEIYQADLCGLEVVNRSGAVLGRVVEVADFGAHPLLRVTRPGVTAEEERLIPYVPAIVDAVDLDGRRMRVDWGEDY
jgi:16S rRNA processing protein RimM